MSEANRKKKMSETLQTLDDTLKTLCEQINDLQIRTEERIKAQHGRFNVFTTLLKADAEVHLHTRFIHELLNPKGTHDCNDLFLKLFFETLKASPPLDHEDSPTSESWDDYSKQSYSISKETRKGQGQLDLLLEANSHLLVIENKISADDQEKQVERYIDFVQSQKHKAGQVLYLTLNGKKAETNNGKAYLRISYDKHIMAWLDRCLHATYQIVPINQVLIQYQKVIQQLIGKTDNKTMETIKNYIRTNPELIKSYNPIGEAIEELKSEAKQRFAETLTESLSDEYHVKPKPRNKAESFVKDPFGILLIQPKKDDFTADHPFSIWFEANDNWNTNIWNASYVGIVEAKPEQERPLTPQERKLLEQMYELVIQKCKYDQSLDHQIRDKKSSDIWCIGYLEVIKQLPWDNDSIADYLDDNHLKTVVKKADGKIRNYINILKEAYQQSKGNLTE